MNHTYMRGEINTNHYLNYGGFFEPLNPISIDLWDKIKKCKIEFLNDSFDVSSSSLFSPEIAESWIRSKKNNVNPFAEKVGERLKKEDFQNLLHKKKLLINTVSAYFNKFKPLLTASEYVMSLTDENATILLVVGNEKDCEYFDKINMGVSSNIREEIAGTTSPSLSLYYHKPVQNIGPYNYSVILDNNISSSAPIFDEYNNIIGTLNIAQIIAKKDSKNMQAHSLGWIIAMKNAIENLLKAEKNNGILKTTLSLVDEGIITVNKRGYVSHINNEGAKILGVQAKELLDKHYSVFMPSEQSQHISEVLSRGSSVYDFETTIVKSNTEFRVIINIRPILNELEDDPQGAVFRLVHAEKLNRLVAHRVGATALFTFKDNIGTSQAFQSATQMGKRVGGNATSLLLIGESGTGKELFAQAIHNEFCSDGPFLAINCAAMPRSLIESELFGYEGGAFTGAERKGRPGKIELANGGTLFLDEIGDMPLEIQPILLRVLEEKRIMRIGGSRYITVDFRVIAATNKDLYQMVLDKNFREDLYFRLSVFKITIPPLRQRDDDILLLASYFIEKISNKLKRPTPTLSPKAVRRLMEYNWPGNVRQLHNAMVYAVNMVQDGVIELNHLPEEIVNNKFVPNSTTKIISLEEAVKAAILNAAKITGNDTMEMARLLGVGRSTLYRKLKEYGVL